MYKNLAVVVFLQFLFHFAAAQTSRRPMGIPDFTVTAPQSLQQLSIVPLDIPSNQTIAPLSICICMSGCTVVPVDLLKFEGKRVSEILVMLNWETANEMQNRGFEVQRSLGNTAAFKPVAFVPAKTQGGNGYKYELPDNNDFSGISYYRLKQVDVDGNNKLSDIVPVKGYGKANSLALYPNPVSDKLTAEIFSAGKTTAVLRLTDATQKLLYSATINLNKGINRFNIPAAQLGSGLYFVNVITESNILLPAKFIKL